MPVGSVGLAAVCNPLATTPQAALAGHELRAHDRQQRRGYHDAFHSNGATFPTKV
jgi:hypothetical protein